MSRLFLIRACTCIFLWTSLLCITAPFNKIDSEVFGGYRPSSIRRNDNETANKIEEWTQQLYADDPAVSSSAAISLLALGHDSITKFLLETLEDTNNDNVRISILKAFGFNGDDRAAGPAIELLDSDNDAVKTAAVETLGKMNTPTAVDKMAAAMLDKNRSLDSRLLLIQALGNVRNRNVVEPLITVMASDEKALQLAAQQALERITKQTFSNDVELWQEWWDKNKIKTREQWLEEIVEKLESKIETLEGRLEALHKEFARKTIMFLELMIEHGNFKPLLDGMHSEYSEVRVFSAKKLVNFKDPATVSAFIAALSDMQKDVRVAAAQGLGVLGNEMVVDPLIAALHDEEIEVQEAAAKSLGMLGFPRPVDALISTLDSSESKLVVASVEALGHIGDKRAVEPLINLLFHKEPNVREAAAFALGRLNDSRCVGPLIKALDDNEERIRWFAADSLGKLGAVESVGPLIKLLSDSSARVRESAAKALGQIRSEKAIEPLLKAIQDHDERVAKQAADALVSFDYEVFEISNELATTFYKNMDYKRAIQVLQKQISKFSTVPGYEKEIWHSKLLLARSFYNLKDWQKAAALYEVLIRYFIDDAEIRIELAVCLKETKQYDKVIELYAKSLKEFSANNQTWWQGRLDVASTFYEEGNYQRTKELIEDFRKEDPALGGVSIKNKFNELERKCDAKIPKKEEIMVGTP